MGGRCGRCKTTCPPVTVWQVVCSDMATTHTAAAGQHHQLADLFLPSALCQISTGPDQHLMDLPQYPESFSNN